MKIQYKPEGGRCGYGFDYFCDECGEYLGNTTTRKTIQHPETRTVTKGFFNKKTVTIEVKCSNAGVTFPMRLPTFIV